MQKEKWLPIKQCNGKKEISSFGRVRNAETKRILKHCLNRLGYPTISFWVEGWNKSFRVHRLVAEHFLPPNKKRKQVNHKDFDKTNNKLENLEWCTNKENVRHFYRNKFKGKISDDDVLYIRKNIEYVGMVRLAKMFKVNEGYILGIANGEYKGHIHQEFIRGKKYSNPKGIIEYDMNGNEVRVYDSASQASKMKNVTLARIKEVLTGGRKSHLGCVYKYQNSEDFYYKERCKGKKNEKREKKILVHRYTPSGEFVDSFYTQAEAAKAIGVNKKGVYKALHGKQKTAGGFVLKYADLE